MNLVVDYLSHYAIIGYLNDKHLAIGSFLW